MRLIPTRQSKKQRALKAARKTAKQAAKAKAVQKAPKTAGAVWAGRRSGKLVRVVLVVVGGAAAFKALRGKRSGDAEPGGFAPPAPPTPTGAAQNGTGESYRTTPTPSSSQQTEGGGASGPDPAGPTTTEQAKDDIRQTAPGTVAAPGEGGAAADDITDTAPGAAPAESESATPPHGDPLADDASKEP